MNETVMQNPAFVTERQVSSNFPTLKGWGTEFSAYVLLTLLIVFGWLVRDRDLISPKEGAGYWLGIIGGTLMLLLLLYPLRKRVKLFRRIGSTKQWFLAHVILGLIGPLLVLYHANFQLGSFNSRVALYCMLLVAGSGIIGRHFYARIHRGLDGHKATMKELQKELAESVDQSRGLAKIVPRVVGRLHELTIHLQGDQVSGSVGVRRSLRWTFTHHFMRLSLLLTARRELRAAVASRTIVAADEQRLNRAVSRYIRKYTRLAGRVSQLSFYERLFAIWHVFHLPTFFIMVLAALFHVLAVHMY